jgi:hypothetical protein
MNLAAWMILVAIACGAAAPPKQPTTQPARDWPPKDITMGMSEAQVVAACEKGGIRIVSREVKEGAKGEFVSLSLSDNRKVAIRGGKVISQVRENPPPETAAELQRDAKVGMTEKEATDAIATAGVKITERRPSGPAILLVLDDRRVVVVREGKVVSIQMAQSQPTKK